MTEKATIVEMVLFKKNSGISQTEAENQMSKLNDFISKQSGFISRKTSVSKDGEFLDIVFWTDLESVSGNARSFCSVLIVLVSVSIVSPTLAGKYAWLKTASRRETTKCLSGT